MALLGHRPGKVRDHSLQQVSCGILSSKQTLTAFSASCLIPTNVKVDDQYVIRIDLPEAAVPLKLEGARRLLHESTCIPHSSSFPIAILIVSEQS